MGRPHKEHRKPPTAGSAATAGTNGRSSSKPDHGRPRGKSFSVRCTTPQPSDLPPDELLSPPEEWKRSGHRGRSGDRSRSRAGSRAQSRASSPVGRRAGTGTSLPGNQSLPIPPFFAENFKTKAPKQPPAPTVKPDNLYRPSWIQPHPFMRPDDTNAIYTDQWLACADQAFPGDIMFIGSLLLTELWLAMKILPAELYDKLCVLICAVLRSKHDDRPSIIPLEVAEGTIEDLWSFLRTVRFAQLDTKCQQANVQIVSTGKRIDRDLSDLLAQGFFKKHDFNDMSACCHITTFSQRTEDNRNGNARFSITAAIDSISWMAFFGVRAAISCVAHARSVDCECPHHIRIDPSVALSSAASDQIPLDDTFNLARSVAHVLLEESLFMPVNSKGLGVLNKQGIEFVNTLVQQRSIALSSPTLSVNPASRELNDSIAPATQTMEPPKSSPILLPSDHKGDPTHDWQETRQLDPLPGVGFVSRATKKSRTGGPAFKARKPLPSFKSPASRDPSSAADKADPQGIAVPDAETLVKAANSCDEVNPSLPRTPSEAPSQSEALLPSGPREDVIKQPQRKVSTLGPSTSTTMTRASLKKRRARPKLPTETPSADEELPPVPPVPSQQSETVPVSQHPPQEDVARLTPTDTVALKPTSSTLSSETRSNETEVDRVTPQCPIGSRPSINTNLLSVPTVLPPQADIRLNESKASIPPLSTGSCKVTKSAPIPTNDIDRFDDAPDYSVQIHYTYHVFEGQEFTTYMCRTESFTQLLEEWKALFASRTEHIAERLLLPQQFMFIWNGRPLQFYQTPMTVGMQHRAEVVVLDAMDASLSLNCHKAGFNNEVLKAITCRNLLRRERGLDFSPDGITLFHAIARRHGDNPSLEAEETQLSAPSLLQPKPLSTFVPLPHKQAVSSRLTSKPTSERTFILATESPNTRPFCSYQNELRMSLSADPVPTCRRAAELRFNAREASSEKRLLRRTSPSPGRSRPASFVGVSRATSPVPFDYSSSGQASNSLTAVGPSRQSIGKLGDPRVVSRPLGTVSNSGSNEINHQPGLRALNQKSFPVYDAQIDSKLPFPLKTPTRFSENNTEPPKSTRAGGAPPTLAALSGSVRASDSKSTTLSRSNQTSGEKLLPCSYATELAAAPDNREEDPGCVVA